MKKENETPARKLKSKAQMARELGKELILASESRTIEEAYAMLCVTAIAQQLDLHAIAPGVSCGYLRLKPRD